MPRVCEHTSWFVWDRQRPMRNRRYREVKIKVEDRPGNLGAIIGRL